MRASRKLVTRTLSDSLESAYESRDAILRESELIAQVKEEGTREIEKAIGTLWSLAQTGFDISAHALRIVATLEESMGRADSARDARKLLDDIGEEAQYGIR